MAQTKPKCQDFIVAAIRMMRQQPPNIVPPTAWSGFPLYQLYKVALDAYSAPEINKAINSLLVKGTVLAVATGTEVGSGLRVMHELLPKTELFVAEEHRAWILNDQGEVFLPATKHERTSNKTVWFPRLYIAADGIPSSVATAIERAKSKKPKRQPKARKKTKAEEIIALMQKGNKDAK